jgi:hypothetical protein
MHVGVRWSDELVLVGLVEAYEECRDLDVESLADLLELQGWSADRVVATTGRALREGRLYQDCRRFLHVP